MCIYSPRAENFGQKEILHTQKKNSTEESFSKPERAGLASLLQTKAKPAGPF